MDKLRSLLNKTLVIGIIFLFIGIAFQLSIASDTVTSTTQDYNGSLLGYVNDTSGNLIEGALVRVYFHETYEEDYSDSTGYYHVTNIPICWCYKNCTASKAGYETEWVLLGIYGNTTYDFVLTPITQYDGSLSGYVNDTDMNPIEGARVRVYFHETYEEDYSDSIGYYHVNNIPKCYCLNATCSKEGYKTEWVLLGIYGNTTYDFVLKPNYLPSKPNIDGEKGVVPGVEFDYYFSAIDPEGDDVRFHIDWGDNTIDTTGFYKSGETVTIGHIYWKKGETYPIWAFAEDIHGLRGPKSTYFPEWENRAVNFNLLEHLFERFPVLEVFLRAMNLQR